MNLERIKKVLTAVLALGVAFLAANATGALGFQLPESWAKWVGIGIACLGFLGKSLFGWVLPGTPTIPVPKLKVPRELPSDMTTTPRILALAIFLLSLPALLALASCATTKTGPLTGPTTSAPLQIIADCGAPAVRDVASHLVDDVASALIVTGDWREALNAVAARTKGDAWPAMKCAIAEVAARADIQLGARARMEPDAVQVTETRRGRAVTWLSEHPG